MSTDAFEITVPPRLGPPAVRALADQLDAAARSPARVVTLVGGRRIFCRGLDLASALAERPGSASTIEASAAGFADLLARLRHLPRPTVAVVRGAALGGGLGLAAACDVVLAAADARFGLPEALVGLAPAIIAPVLRERMSPQRLRRLALTGLSVDAADALDLGLVDAAGPVDALDGLARQWVRLLGRAAPTAVARLKGPGDATPGTLHRDARRGAETTARLLADHDTRALIAARLAGEAPWGAS